MIFLDVSVSFEKINFEKQHKISTNTSSFEPLKCCAQTRIFLFTIITQRLPVAYENRLKFCLNLLRFCYSGLQCSISNPQWRNWAKQMTMFADLGYFVLQLMLSQSYVTTEHPNTSQTTQCLVPLHKEHRKYFVLSLLLLCFQLE